MEEKQLTIKFTLVRCIASSPRKDNRQQRRRLYTVPQGRHNETYEAGNTRRLFFSSGNTVQGLRADV